MLKKIIVFFTSESFTYYVINVYVPRVRANADKCLQHHQGCPETQKKANVICERLPMLWTLWDLKYHFWNILFCHRHTGSIGSSVVWVVPSDRRAQQADPQLTMSPYYWPQKSPESYLPSGSQGPERRLGHLERGGHRKFGDQLLTRVSNLALSNEETGIVQTVPVHSVRCDKSLGALGLNY